MNPYESPLTESQEPSAAPPPATSYVGGTIIPRSLAASLDGMLSAVLALIAGWLLPEDLPLLQLAAMTAVWLAYYLLTEGPFSGTPGKRLAGLAVLQIDGTRITWRQAFVRTLFRLLEVNPVLVGALPAALCIIFSRRRQRMGDMVAGTVVVSVKHMRD